MRTDGEHMRYSKAGWNISGWAGAELEPFDRVLVVIDNEFVMFNNAKDAAYWLGVGSGLLSEDFDYNTRIPKEQE